MKSADVELQPDELRCGAEVAASGHPHKPVHRDTGSKSQTSVCLLRRLDGRTAAVHDASQTIGRCKNSCMVAMARGAVRAAASGAISARSARAGTPQRGVSTGCFFLRDDANTFATIYVKRCEGSCPCGAALSECADGSAL